MSKWLQRLYYWWVIGDWRLAKRQADVAQLRQELRQELQGPRTKTTRSRP